VQQKKAAKDLAAFSEKRYPGKGGDNVIEDKLEERLELSMLYDFYGALLKENKREMFEAYILEDYSITEIAEEFGITRQGVHDAIKRVTGQLRDYEEKLGLVQRFEEQRKAVKRLHQLLLEKNISEEMPEWKEILEILQDILE
jgi:hypothetical protein